MAPIGAIFLNKRDSWQRHQRHRRKLKSFPKNNFCLEKINYSDLLAYLVATFNLDSTKLNSTYGTEYAASRCQLRAQTGL